MTRKARQCDAEEYPPSYESCIMESRTTPENLNHHPRPLRTSTDIQPLPPSSAYGPSYEYKTSPHSPLHRSRSCTDILCLLLFLAFIGCWVFVAYLGTRTGDVSKVLFPTDSQGRICGQGQLASRPYLLIFDLSKCLSPSSLVSGCPTPHVCVSQCPQENYSPLASARLRTETQHVIKQRVKPFCSPTVTDQILQQFSVQDLVESGECPSWYLSSSPVLGRCLPHTEQVLSEAVLVGSEGTSNLMQVSKGNLNVAITRLAGVLSLREFGEKVFSDLLDTWWIIGLALVGATILSFVWIFVLRFLTGPMIWLSILMMLAGLVGLLAYCSYRLYLIIVSADPATLGSILSVSWTPYFMEEALQLRDTWLAFTVILGAVLVILVLLLLVLRKRISMAISLIEEAALAISQTLSCLLFPIIPFSMQVVVCAWFLLVAALIATSSTQEYRVVMPEGTNCSIYSACLSHQPADLCSPSSFSACQSSCAGAACQFVKYSKNQDHEYLQIVNVFGLLWGLFFCSSFSELVLAGVFSHWYWRRGRKRLPSWPVGRAVFYTTVFHLGTVAFGSLIIAVIRMIRLVLEYIEKRIKKFNNELGRCILCCCKGCLWCLENCVRFINRNAFIMCAVNGTNFCKSAKDAFNLIMRNFVRVVVLNSVCDLLFFIGKVIIVAATGSVSYLVFGGYIPHIREDIPALNYFFIPCVFIVIGSYLIASAFFSVYSMAVDTLFLCFLEDLERNDGSAARPYFMSRKLMKVLGKKIQAANQEHGIVPTET